MAKHTHVFKTPAFWFAFNNGEEVKGNPRNNYGYASKGELSTGQDYLDIFDTEEEMAAYIDLQVGEPGWYYKCENRIPYPPNPNQWECTEEEVAP
jgi:hypothetical protein